MLVDDIGDVTITNDGATILKMLGVKNPAAEVLVELAELQDCEVGDGTTSVVIIAAELLKLAMQEASKYIDDKPSSLAVKSMNDKGEIKYPIKVINILKAHGKSAKEIYLLNGYALNTGRAAQGMLKRLAPARIACLDVNLQRTKLQMGIQVLVTDPRELEKIRQQTKGIDDMALKYFVVANAIAVRGVSKEDMRHIAKATGATQVLTFADIEGGETFDAALLGSAEEVVEERVADDDVILIKGAKSSRAVSILLRGANDYMLDEMECSIHNSLSIVKWTLESNMVVAGGGAEEAALSVYLENLATTLGSREQLAVVEFALALLIIPKVLAVNVAKDATELVAKLCAYHHNAQTKADKQHLSGYVSNESRNMLPLRKQVYSRLSENVQQTGLDLIKGVVRNNVEAGVIEPSMSKLKIIQVSPS
ncbi:unnamed protein product [Sphagnum balticum]